MTTIYPDINNTWLKARYECLVPGSVTKKLEGIYVDDKKINISNLWINDQPADCIKNFKLTNLQNNGIAEKVCSEGIVTKIKITYSEGDWSQMKEYKVYKFFNEAPLTYIFFPSFKIKGVKRYLRAYNSPAPDLYDINGYELDNDLTLEECNIHDIYTFPNSLHSSSVGAQGFPQNEEVIYNNFFNLKTFEIFCHRMLKISQIVCKVIVKKKSVTKENKVIEKINTGSGFLIGKNLVITNNHVFSKDDEIKQLEFYLNSDSNSNNRLIISKYFEIVGSSPPPFGLDDASNTTNKLDFVIIKFKVPTFLGYNDFKNYIKILRLSRMAQAFFTPNRTISPRNETANIIQFPYNLKELKGSKKIVFRENNVAIKHDYGIMHYSTNTEHGASGSPVINDQGELIGIHYSECKLLNRKLLKAIDILLPELDLTRTNNSTDEQGSEFCSITYNKDNNFLQGKIYIKGFKKGAFVYNEGKKNIETTLLGLIKKVSTFNKKIGEDHRSWAIKYITRIHEHKDHKKDQGLDKHKNCNNAIIAEVIYNAIKTQTYNNSKETVFDHIEKNNRFTMSDFKPFVYTIGVYIAVGGLCGLGLNYLHQKYFKK